MGTARKKVRSNLHASTCLTHPRSSRNRQITLATTSSFFSKGPCVKVLLILVRAASFSDAVAPKHNAKSIVDDCVVSVRTMVHMTGL